MTKTWEEGPDTLGYVLNDLGTVVEYYWQGPLIRFERGDGMEITYALPECRLWLLQRDANTFW